MLSFEGAGPELVKKAGYSPHPHQEYHDQLIHHEGKPVIYLGWSENRQNYQTTLLLQWKLSSIWKKIFAKKETIQPHLSDLLEQPIKHNDKPIVYLG